MNYLTDFEPKAVIIRYWTYSSRRAMEINVQTFLTEQTLVKIKKLLHLIRGSDTPELEGVLANYCQQWLAQYEVVQKINANTHVDSKEKARKIEIDIEYHRRMRDSRYKKNTEPYKQITELLKEKKRELSAENQIARTHLTEFNRNVKIKEKFDKVLEFINQG